MNFIRQKAKRLPVLLFWFRVVVWLATPGVYLLLPVATASILILSLLALIAIFGWITGHTFWLTARPVALTILLVYVTAVTGALIYQQQFRWDTLAVLCTLILSLGSDVISARKRSIYLAMLLGLAWPSARLAIRHNPHLQFLEYLWPAGAIAGACARLSWPQDPDSLLRTSLDYWFGRIEIISWGMKKLLAIGLKR